MSQLHLDNAVEYGYNPHDFDYGDGLAAIRKCWACNKREAAWDDESYPIDPCPALRYAVVYALPGCLPDNEPECFPTIVDAQNYVDYESETYGVDPGYVFDIVDTWEFLGLN